MLNNAFVSTCFYVSRILFPSWKSEREVGSWGAKCPLTAYFLFMRQRKQCNLKTGVVSRRHRWESPPHTPCLLWMRHAWLSQRSQAVTGASVSHRSMAGSPHLCSPAQLLWQTSRQLELRGHRNSELPAGTDSPQHGVASAAALPPPSPPGAGIKSSASLPHF